MLIVTLIRDQYPHADYSVILYVGLVTLSKAGLEGFNRASYKLPVQANGTKSSNLKCRLFLTLSKAGKDLYVVLGVHGNSLY